MPESNFEIVPQNGHVYTVIVPITQVFEFERAIQNCEGTKIGEAFVTHYLTKPK